MLFRSKEKEQSYQQRQQPQVDYSSRQIEYQLHEPWKKKAGQMNLYDMMEPQAEEETEEETVGHWTKKDWEGMRNIIKQSYLDFSWEEEDFQKLIKENFNKEKFDETFTQQEAFKLNELLCADSSQALTEDDLVF